jgi:hypothetical protein
VVTPQNRCGPQAEPDRESGGQCGSKALAFQKRQEVAADVQALQEACVVLDLRSYADWGERIYSTLKKAMADPDSVNAPQLLNELADNFIAEIPNAFSNR